MQYVNLVAPLLLCQELIAPLKQARGAVVDISFIAAHQVHSFAGSVCAVSKAGSSSFTRELGEVDVRVNVVAPGELKAAILSPGTEKVVGNEVPMKRLGRPEEVAEVVHLLSSSQSSYV
ncbi:SDR family NAD(P)-dependent oxidoreductase [Tateyamaria sp.]|uniref:SDR family NAD(P)-dependent oxidoreductase n=1 Tax=Tateyamaria sp. TaxID=1929288 RepID=UPI00329DCEEB